MGIPFGESPDAALYQDRYGDWADAGHPVSREMIDRLTAFLADLGRLSEGPHGQESAPLLLADLLQELYGGGWVILVRPDFDWTRWAARSAGLCGKPGTLEAADTETLRRVLTVLARQYREEGLGDAFEYGSIVRVLTRLATLRDATPTREEHVRRAIRIDEAFAASAEISARYLKRLPGKEFVLESQLEQVLLAALRPSLPADLTPAPLMPHGVTTWTGPLGRLDLGVTDSAGVLAGAAELKVESVDQTLWDAYKLAAIVGYRVPGYLVVVASKRAWAEYGQCCELFQPGVVEHSTEELFQRNAGAWEALKKGGSARPVLLPKRIQTRAIAAVPLVREPELELRIAGVRSWSIPDDYIDRRST